MPPVTVGELRVLLSGDTSRLDRDMDRIDNRAGATEKTHTAAWQRTGNNAGKAITAGMLAAEKDADKIGNRTGGKLSQGINQGLIRNSPLIVAGVAGALAAGAPLVTAGAVALFAGAGAVAASQSLEIREAWTQLGHEIRGGMVADAAVLVPVYTKMADQIGASFQRMRPMIREAFVDSIPLVDSFTDGVIALAENAMPGLVRTIDSAGPVMDGLKDFLASTGTGLADFFDAISGHAPAAGTAFASLGDILGDLLPILGELLGQGAELAADVLPAVAAVTGTVLDVMQLLGPALPGVVAGFVAFKTAQTAAGYLQTLAVQAQYATIAMTGSVTAGSKVGGVLAGVGRALPAVGVAVGVVSAAMAVGEQRINGWTQALLEGGKAASLARAEMTEKSWVDQGIFASDSFTWLREIAGWMGEGELAAESAREEYDALTAAMSPLEQAELRVAQATNKLDDELDVYGEDSRQAADAARALAAEQAILEGRQAALELAIHGVTSAMIAQAEQALAAASADYAYRSSLEGIDDAIAGIAEAQRVEAEAAAASAEAQRVHGVGSDEAAEAARRHTEATEATSDAQFRLEGTLLSAAEAAGRLAADALPATASELQKQQAAAAGSLGELERLKTEMGANFPPALQLAIDRLKQSGVALTNTTGAASVTAAAMRDLGLSVNEVPGQKFVKVDAPTAEQRQRLIDLGYLVTDLPDGDIYVSADTATANAAIDYAARPRVATVRVVTQGGVHISGPAGSGTIPERAAGGPVWPGQTFLVGEQGPELVRFSGLGTVIDAKETAAMVAAGQGAGRQFAPTNGSALAASAQPGNRLSAGAGGTAVVENHKHYHWQGNTREEMTLKQLVELTQRMDWLYGG